MGLPLPVTLHRTSGGIPFSNTTHQLAAIQGAKLGLGGQYYAASPIQETIYPLPVFPNSTPDKVSIHRFFPDVAYSDLSGGVTHYHALMLKVTDDTDFTTTSLELDITQPTTGAVSFWIQAAASAVSIANNTTAPSGASWTTSTQTLSVTPGAKFVVWIRRVISAGASPSNFEYFTLALSDPASGTSYDDRTWVCWYNLKSNGVTISSVTHTGQNTVTRVTDTVTFTATLSADPPNNQVWVAIDHLGTISAADTVQSSKQAASVDLCTRASAGSYTYEFVPPEPGFYSFHFITGEIGSLANLEVQP